MGEVERSQWHPPFYAAMKLELRENRDILSFANEIGLNSKPIQLDLLVIKKDPGAEVKNEIGKIFLGYNIFEYKSPGDELGVDEYFKTLAYACLYKAGGPREDAIRADDITLSMVREKAPMKLLKWLRERHYRVEEKAPGVYYVSGNTLFATQFVVTGELNPADHLWLRALTRTLDEDLGGELLDAAGELKEKSDADNASSIINLTFQENRAVFDRIKEAAGMSEYWIEELFKPELKAARAKAAAEGRKAGMQQGRAEGMQQGLAEGLAEGRAEGQSNTSKVIQQLIAQGRMDDVKRAVEDSDYLDQLIQEYCGKNQG